ncbi:MAG: pentapeptide repeat-containing protein [Nostoc sp. ChiQUE02]|uniref:pentapeptide repeat-containing protein n=1 Tax=Nostoc sp. ChiQUE02 TaxID=3075377 RepID=UPI002AD2F78D|nr:pentapeptide repeat-containing protein [Nostoc sp. ChiQUE02]MDZ8230454.1 pentapeptide repeat-containing protein [Nostoc sp. ChiQUE02]
MSDNNRDTLKVWLIILAVIFIVFLIAVTLIFLFSDFAFLNNKGLEIKQRLDYGAKVLTTLGTIFGGFAVLINAFYAAKRWEAMDKSALAANDSAKAALKNAQIAQDKQITERFAKAIEQLGNEKIETRLGAIYTLERIAKDSKDDHWTIMEVLTAFVRQNVPLQEDQQKSPKIRIDIQAALTVIGRRKSENDPENQSLDLRNVNIKEADLRLAKLQGANLAETNLQGAYLAKANLQRANLAKTNLQGAYLAEANLQGAYFIIANLQGANFAKANLQGAYLTGAKNLVQRQIESAKGDRTTILPEDIELPEHWNT